MADAQYQTWMGRMNNLLASANGAPAGAAAGSSLVSSAQALMGQKKYQEALEIYGKALQQNPKDAAVHYQVALEITT